MTHIATDFDSTYDLPPKGTSVPGKITVLDWTKARVLADKKDISNLVSIKCNRIADQAGSGGATIKVKDPLKTIYNSITEHSEIEIYLSETVPIVYGNKVWGGTLEDKDFLQDEAQTLTLVAKEYLQDLVSKLTSATEDAGENSFTNIEPGEIIKTLMAKYQVDYSTDNVLTGNPTTMTVTFLNKSLYGCIKEICDTFNYIFYINLDRDLVVRQRETVVSSTDNLTYGTNAKSISQEKNKEFMVNEVRVYGDGVSATAIDQDSKDLYGENIQKVNVPSLKTEADCQNYANQYIVTWKIPTESLRSVSRLLPDSDIFDFIAVDASGAELDGDYQIIELKYNYSKKGIVSETILSKKINDLSISLGQMLSRLSQLETTNYT